MIRQLGTALIVALFLSACGASAPEPGRAGQKVGQPYRINGVRYVPRADPDYDQVGMASWYGSGFHGKTTASGGRYDMNTMTAAHKTLPFGTRVRVTNLENGRAVTLTINDRGPFAKGRIIDVSKRAARRLGFIDKGKVRVRVAVIAGPRASRSAAPDREPDGRMPNWKDRGLS